MISKEKEAVCCQHTVKIQSQKQTKAQGSEPKGQSKTKTREKRKIREKRRQVERPFLLDETNSYVCFWHGMFSFVTGFFSKALCQSWYYYFYCVVAGIALLFCCERTD